LNKERLKEEILESLVFEVAGSELDRLRMQIDAALDIPYEKTDEDCYSVCLGNSYHVMAFEVEWEQILYLLHNVVPQRLWKNRRPDELSGVVELIHKEYCSRYGGTNHDKPVPELDIACVVLMKIAEMEKGEIPRRTPNRRLTIFHLGYRTLAEEDKALFLSVWRHPQGLLHA